MNLSTLFPRFAPRTEHRPRAHGGLSSDATRIRWLGTASHVVSTSTTTVLIDPFLTRPSFLRTATRRLSPQPEAWWKWLPPKVDAVCVGHSHYDHLLDAPVIAERTGALLIGSRSTINFGRAHGLPNARMVEVASAGLKRRVGDIEIEFVPSVHGRFLAGRVPYPGEVTMPPSLPARVFHYRMGGAFGVLLRTPTTTVYHNGSADLVDAALEGMHADVLLAGLAGRQATRDYVARLTGLLSPKLIMPTHHDLFFAPLEAGVRVLPSVNLVGFTREAAQLCPGARVFTPTYRDELHVPESTEDAVFMPYSPK